jgi:hypothetical protein
MAYEDPYYQPTPEVTTEDSLVVPPEATKSKPQIGLILSLTAGSLILIGVVLGLAIERNRDSTIRSS